MSAKKGYVSDMLWYLSGAIIPLIIGLIKSPIYTRQFSPEEFGYYSLLIHSFTLASIFLYKWVTSCVWRFYNQYKNNGELAQFYTHLILFFCIASGVLIIGSGTVSVFFMQPSVKYLLFALVFQFITDHIISLVLLVNRLEGRSAFYNIVKSIQVSVALLVSLGLIFYFDFGIVAIPIGMSIINLMLIGYLILSEYGKRAIAWSGVQPSVLKLFLGYGFMSVISHFCVMLLAISDRYLIAYYGSIDEVGIYNQIYGLAEISIAMLSNVYFNAVGPKVYELLSSRKKAYLENIREFQNGYLLLFIPISFVAILFAKELAHIMLGADFRVGYRMLPILFLSAFVLGATNLYETRIKFDKNYSRIYWGFISATLINTACNIIAIPKYGYQTASLTTLLSYVVLFCFLSFPKGGLKENITGFSLKIFVLSLLMLPALFWDYFASYPVFSFIGILARVIVMAVFLLIFAVMFYSDRAKLKLIWRAVI